ncbi:hypothetical protein HAX54_027651 [Datura stramonium]|uniref:Uncharacterized protein n=1 Tax=Datura stramonium TaxID=4076 RepID=A0ABS8S8X7_DATST|nr:hypothetical protein [Datura stramonium]
MLKGHLFLSPGNAMPEVGAADAPLAEAVGDKAGQSFLAVRVQVRRLKCSTMEVFRAGKKKRKALGKSPAL